MTVHARSELGSPRLDPRRWELGVMLAIVAVISIVGALWGERIPVNGGAGWDGEFYVRWARDPSQIFSGGVNAYQLQRVLPSLIVHGGLLAAGGTSVEAAIAGFVALNVVLLLISTVLWWSIGRQLALGIAGRWIGFAGLFVNFAFAKMPTYYPALTDVAALTVGLALLTSYLACRRAAIVALALVGAFVWPTTAAIGAAMLLFPRGEGVVPGERRGPLATPLALGLTVGLCALFVYLYYGRGWQFAAMGPAVPVIRSLVPVSVALYAMPAVPVIRSLVPVSVALYAMVVFLASRELFRGLEWRWMARTLRAVRLSNVLLAALVLMLPRVVVAIAAGAGDGPEVGGRRLLGFLTVTANTRPGVMLVAHVVYFGPIVLLIVAFWNRIVGHLRSLGGAMLIAALATFLLSLTTESRQTILTYPAVVAGAALAIDEVRWDVMSAVVFGAVSVGLSKVWFSINEGWGGEAMDLPRYFMHTGPWMSDEAFWLQGAVVTACAAALALALRRAQFRMPSEARAQSSAEQVAGATRGG